MNLTRYMVLSEDGSLYGYNNEALLLCHLAIHKDNPPKQIFRLSDTALAIRYDPINANQIPESSPSETQLRLAA
jgi:hypothetical protein